MAVMEPDVQDPELDQGEGKVTHIVRTDPGESAASKVMEARLTGTPIEALCGYVWVPENDPRNYPVCERCKEIFDLYRSFNDGIPEQPPFA